MLLRLRNAVASMHQANQQQERTANNLANANTIGYRRDRLFVTALNERLDIEGAPTSDRLTEQAADTSAGQLEETGNPLDVALRGEGLFEVMDEATGAMRYTRAGRFTADAEGTLRTPGGLVVQGDAGPLQLPPNAGTVEIDDAGRISADGQPVGQLRVVTFADASRLQRLDGATFAPGDAVPQDAQAPGVIQGSVERANVNPIREMTEMIEQFRLFEGQQKQIQTVDGLLGQLVRDTGRF
jgi:flagellar basal-body rod protein FlgF